MLLKKNSFQTMAFFIFFPGNSMCNMYGNVLQYNRGSFVTDSP